MENKISFLRGFLLTLSIALIASLLSNILPLGGVTLAILAGIFIGNIFPSFASKGETGIKFSEKKLLEVAVALTGINLNFQVLYALGAKTLLLVVSTLTLVLMISYFLSLKFSLSRRFGLLVGIGSGVCGSSAIAATEKILGTTQEETGISVAVVNFLGTVGLFVLPVFSIKVAGFSEISTGIWIGNSLQAVGQVVAAGFSVSKVAGETAVLVKMARILMLFPLVLILLFFFKKHRKETEVRAKLKFPYFILGFVFFAILASSGLPGTNTIKVIGKAAHYLLVIAMAGIGLRIKFGGLVSVGKKALFFGSFLFLVQLVFTGLILGIWN